MKIFLRLFCPVLLAVLWEMQISSAQVTQKLNLSDSIEEATSKNLFLRGGPVVPALWSFETLILLGEQGFYLGGLVQGTYQVYTDSDLLPSNVIAIDFCTGWGIPKKWRRPWRLFQGTGLGGFIGSGIVDKSYGNTPYNFGFFGNISKTLTSDESSTCVSVHFMPLLFSSIVYQDQHGLTWKSKTPTAWQFDFGVSTVFGKKK